MGQARPAELVLLGREVGRRQVELLDEIETGDVEHELAGGLHVGGGVLATHGHEAHHRRLEREHRGVGVGSQVRDPVARQGRHPCHRTGGHRGIHEVIHRLPARLLGVEHDTVPGIRYDFEARGSGCP